MARKGENIYKRKDGRWEGRYQNGCHTSGRAKYRSIYGKTYQEVKEKLTKLKAETEHYTSSGSSTVKILFKEWFDSVKFRVKASTLANYRMKCDKHILPEFGEMKYEQLSAQMVHSFIANKMKANLSAKYVTDIVIVFKSMAKYVAKVHGFRNPLVNVILPKSEKKELVLFSELEQKTLCHQLMEDVNHAKLGIMLSYYTGLRIGEVCALQWKDIDFSAKTLSIRRTVQRITDRRDTTATRLIIDTPKSASSVRTIPIPAFLLKILEQFRTDTDAYVLSGTDKVVEPRTMQYRFQSFLKKVNLPSINYHSLRHMFATNCIRLGFDVKTLSELLGHASVETTLNRYVHSSMDRKQACMNLLEAIY